MSDIMNRVCLCLELDVVRVFFRNTNLILKNYFSAKTDRKPMLFVSLTFVFTPKGFKIQEIVKICLKTIYTKHLQTS